MTVVTRASARILVLLLALVALLAAQGGSAGSARAATAIVYDSIPAAPPLSYPSIGYQATQTAELGDLVELGGANRDLATVTVGLVSWACESGSWTSGCVTTPGTSFPHPITVTIYEEGTAPAPGAVLAKLTKAVDVPYRPSAGGGCPSATQWRDPATNSCQNGFLFLETFDFTSLVVGLPERVIVTVAFDTQTYGAAPTGVNGPYNSLNVAVVSSLPTVGTDVDPDTMYWNGGVPASGLLAESGWQNPSPQFGLALEIVADDLLSTLPQPTSQPSPGSTTPATGGGSATNLPTLADSGLETNPAVWIGAAVAVALGGVLLALGVRRAATRRGGSHRA